MHVWLHGGAALQLVERWARLPVCLPGGRTGEWARRRMLRRWPKGNSSCAGLCVSVCVRLCLTCVNGGDAATGTARTGGYTRTDTDRHGHTSCGSRYPLQCLERAGSGGPQPARRGHAGFVCTQEQHQLALKWYQYEISGSIPVTTCGPVQAVEHNEEYTATSPEREECASANFQPASNSSVQ